jgi:hypothetical protein
MPTPVTTPRALGQAALGTMPTVVYSAPMDLQSVTVRTIHVANLDPATRACTIWKLPDGAVTAVADEYVIVPGLAIPGHGMLQDDGVHVLGPGGAIVGAGDLAGLVCEVSGAETE